MIKEAYEQGVQAALEKVSGQLGGIIDTLVGRGTPQAMALRNRLAENLRFARQNTKGQAAQMAAQGKTYDRSIAGHGSQTGIQLPGNGNNLETIVGARGAPYRIDLHSGDRLLHASRPSEFAEFMDMNQRGLKDRLRGQPVPQID